MLLTYPVPINVVAIVHSDDRYIFLFDDSPESYQRLMQTLGQFAGNAELSFSWHDAAALSRAARKLILDK